MLQGTTRTWLNSLKPYSINSWLDFTEVFVRNFTIAAATGLPSPIRHAQKLRHDFLVSSVKPQDAGRPVEPPSPSSSTAGSDHHRR